MRKIGSTVGAGLFRSSMRAAGTAQSGNPHHGIRIFLLKESGGVYFIATLPQGIASTH
jgi:hypothetical protein